MEEGPVTMDEARSSLMRVIRYLTTHIPDAKDLVKTLLAVSEYIQDHGSKQDAKSTAETDKDLQFLEVADIENETMLLMQDNVSSKDSADFDRALSTLPKYLSVKHSKVNTTTVGVFTDVSLSSQTCFGPFEGEIKDHPEDNTASCIWQISMDSGEDCYISGSDPTTANWMRFVACTSASKQHLYNLQAFQNDGQIYYRATGSIEAGSELIVCYEYSQGEEPNGEPTAEGAQGSTIERVEEGSTIDRVGQSTTDEGEDEFANQDLDDLRESAWCCACGQTFDTEDLLLLHMEIDHSQVALPIIDASLCELNMDATHGEKTEKKKKKNNIAEIDDIKPVIDSSLCDLMIETDPVHEEGKTKKKKKAVNDGKRSDKDENVKPKKKRKSVQRKKRIKQVSEKKLDGYDAKLGKYRCTTCDLIFDVFSLYKSHARRHTGEKPYQCQDCGRCFRVNAHLKLHVRTHTNSKPYNCTTCDKSFSQYSNLNRHMRTHTGVKPYKCDHCGKSFSDASSYKCHLRLHTGEKPYSCNVCGKNFTSAGAQITHQQTHNTVRKHHCVSCQKSFKSRASHLQHLHKCVGNVKLSCPKCKEEFIGMDKLDAHMEIHFM